MTMFDVSLKCKIAVYGHLCPDISLLGHEFEDAQEVLDGITAVGGSSGFLRYPLCDDLYHTI